MKIGDQKQAMGLGLVAVIAIGFLAKTALGSFAGKTTNKPIEVKDLRGGPAPAEKSTSVTSSPGPTGTNPPVKTPSTPVTMGATPDPKQAINSNLSVRDAFAKFATRPSGPPKGLSNSGTPQTNWREEYSTTGSKIEGEVSPANVNAGLEDPRNKEAGAGKPKNEVPPTLPKKDPIILRFDGYVNAGSPMAVLTYKGATYTVAVGDVLPDGLKVESITNEKIKLSKGKDIKTILVGRESEI